MFVMCYCNLFIKFLLDLDILKFLEPLIEEQMYCRGIMVQVFRLLSKILAGTQQQIQVCLFSIFFSISLILSISLIVYDISLSLSVCVCVCVCVCTCTYVCVYVCVCVCTCV